MLFAAADDDDDNNDDYEVRKKISLAKLLFALSSVIYWMYAFDLSKLHLSKRLNGALFFFHV